jgi:hypothetical protein
MEGSPAIIVMVGQPEAWGQPLSGEPVCRRQTGNPFKQNIILINRTYGFEATCIGTNTFAGLVRVAVQHPSFLPIMVRKGLKMDSMMMYISVIKTFIYISGNTQRRTATLTPNQRRGVDANEISEYHRT